MLIQKYHNRNFAAEGFIKRTMTQYIFSECQTGRTAFSNPSTLKNLKNIRDQTIGCHRKVIKSSEKLIESCLPKAARMDNTTFYSQSFKTFSC